MPDRVETTEMLRGLPMNERMRWVIKEFGPTQEAFAERLRQGGMEKASSNHIVRWTTGRARPGPAYAAVIAEITGLPLDLFLEPGVTSRPVAVRPVSEADLLGRFDQILQVITSQLKTQDQVLHMIASQLESQSRLLREIAEIVARLDDVALRMEDVQLRHDAPPGGGPAGPAAAPGGSERS